MSDLQEAVEKVRMGPERRSRIITDDEKRLVAYHEAGHALVAHMIAEADPVHKVSIIARGGAGGFTMFLPQDDQTLVNKTELKARLAVSLGGRAAEEEVFIDVTTGASGDLEHVTRVARAMVTQFGMSEKLGPLTFGDKEELIFLGRQLSEQRNYSDDVAEQIDLEVRVLVDEAHERALSIIREHRDKLEAITNMLMEHETIDAAAFVSIFSPEDRPIVDKPVTEAAATPPIVAKKNPPILPPSSAAPLPA